MALPARVAGPFGAACTFALLLGGCATGGQSGARDTAEAGYPGTVSAREYGYVRPAVDVLVMERGAAGRVAPGGRSDGQGDLWGRVRAGMRLEHYADSRIDRTLERFRADPQYLARMSQQARPYLHVIVSEIERRGLPMELALLPHVESRFNPAATSPKAAAGIWQFMPYTGREMGLRQDVFYDGRRDLLASTGAALNYLEQLNQRFDGDWALAMAAYNCGPGRVAAAQAANRTRGRPTDFWSLSLPNETKEYVPKILATARLVAEPRKYGLTLPPVPDHPQLEVVRTQRPIELARLAAASGIQLHDLQRLNPALKLGRTAPQGPNQVLVPAGAGQRIGKKLVDQVQIVPATASVSPTYATALSRRGHTKGARDHLHVVRGGQSLASIARLYGVQPLTLAQWNGISSRETLLPGQTLRVGPPDDSVVRHRVVKGDSMQRIARRYGVRVRDIQRWNRLAGNDLNPGDLLLIYPAGSAPTS